MKLYTNKSSLKKPNTRMTCGGRSEIQGNFISWWDRADITTDALYDIPLIIGLAYAKRADLIAFDYYGSASLEWVILQYNNIVDINEELVYGRRILVPSPPRIRMMQPVN
jgi:hypothetical protein